MAVTMNVNVSQSISVLHKDSGLGEPNLWGPCEGSQKFKKAATVSRHSKVFSPSL